MGLLVLSVLLWGAAAAAEPSPNEISWVQTDAEAVARFVVLIGPSEARSSVNTRVIDVGRPAGQAIGGNRTLFRAIVSMEAEESVAVSAVSHEGLASAPSAWLTPVPTQPGQPQVVTP
jgi:hypothetical protein